MLSCRSCQRCLSLIASLLVCGITSAQTIPRAELAAHSQGKLQLTINGVGQLGVSYFGNDGIRPFRDPFTGDSVRSCEYPRGSGGLYPGGSLHIGAVVVDDTLVTNFWELANLDDPLEQFQGQTIDFKKPYFSTRASSELDLITEYYDTFIENPRFPTIGWDERLHLPLGLRVRQQSMAWSADLIDDFVLVDYEITNVGRKHLQDVWVAFNTGNGVSHFSQPNSNDDLIGNLRRFRAHEKCLAQRSFNLAYSIDNDGDPLGDQFTLESPRAAVGLMVLGTSATQTRVNFNWWQGANNLRESWGPRQKGTIDNPLRPIGPFLGQPYKDANLYYVMRHAESDYDQLFAAVDYRQLGWLSPPPNADSIGAGFGAQYLLSFGSFELGAGEKINFTIAIVGGENVHTDPTAYERLFDPLNPQPFYYQLDFSHLIENARWAKRVYDNPGVDTDGDGNFGEFCMQDGDTIWYEGDGIPDFKANTPPPAPFVTVTTRNAELVLRWNGFLSETTKDKFVGVIDFEGYNVYAGLDDRRSSLTLLTSFDKHNYVRYRFETLPTGDGRWVNEDFPLTLDSLEVLYSDPDFDPLLYSRARPLYYGGEHWYFEEMGFNRSVLGHSSLIHKAYPHATDPGLDSTLWSEDDVTYEHDGRRSPRFYEYEYVYDNLLPTRPYFVGVTAFDFGSKGGRIPPQENNPLNNLILAYAQNAAELVEEQELDAYVYPNPYRVDVDYAGRGFENRKDNIIPDRARLIHFGNLPTVCTISIFSLDGDLIGMIEHNFPGGGPEAMHDWWNLVSRSGLAVTSGLYYWTVESETRTQIGKLVILK